MEGGKLVLDYFRVLASPVLTFVIICIVIYTFKEPVKGLLSKLSSIKLPGGAELKTTQNDNIDIDKEIEKHIEATLWIVRSLLSTSQSESTDATPDEINARKRELVAFQGQLIALEVGMRQLVAWSHNSDRDVEAGILAISRHFKENPDEAAKGISRTYPEYDLEMAKMLVLQIAESLESFLPIRLSGSVSGGLRGSSTATVSKREGSTAAE